LGFAQRNGGVWGRAPLKRRQQTLDNWIWTVLMVAALVAIIGITIFYFLNKWAGKKAAQQQDMVNQHRQSVSIYVIDKKKDKITNAGFPKAVADQIPRMAKLVKSPLVKAKIGPQIMTLVCDAAVFDALPLKKTVTVEIAGAYIVGMKGMKTKMEMAEIRKARRKDGSEAAASKPWYKKLKK